MGAIDDAHPARTYDVYHDVLTDLLYQRIRTFQTARWLPPFNPGKKFRAAFESAERNSSGSARLWLHTDTLIDWNLTSYHGNASGGNCSQLISNRSYS
jgi:hypothetical protein